MKPYIEALRKSVTEDSVVLDIGTGVGIFALVAARLGAQKIYAVEPNLAIEVARELAIENNCDKKIEFIHGLSTDISLPDRVDVIVSDLRGTLPLSGKNLSSIIDARDRFLKPGGTLIPETDKLFAAVVEASELHKPNFADDDGSDFGLHFRAAEKYLTNSWQRGRVKPEQLLAKPAEWARIEYWKVNSTDLYGDLTWSMSRQGTGHGFVLWFDTLLLDNIGFSNAPGGGAKVYGSAFFPWTQAVQLNEGDQVDLSLSATLVDDDYIWSWETKVFDQNRQFKSHFKQSTFCSQLFSPTSLLKSSADYVATLSCDDQIDKFVLNRIDGSATQGQIAGRLMQQFPASFLSLRDALTRVGEVANRYSESSTRWARKTVNE